MSLGGSGNHNNGQQDSRPTFNNSRQQEQMPNQNSQSFSNEKEDLNRQFNRPMDRSDRSSDAWSRYESQERGPGMGQGAGPGYDNSKYGSRPPPSSSSTSSRPGEQGRGGQMGGMSSEGGFMGRQGSSSELKAMGNGRMGEGGGNMGMGQGYRSSRALTSMGGNSNSGAPIMGGSNSGGAPIMGGGSSGAPIISEGRRGAMAASGGLPMDRGMVGSFYTSEAPTSISQSWIGEQRRGGSNTTMANNFASHTSTHPQGAPWLPSPPFPPPGIPGNFPPPTSRTDQGLPVGSSSSAGFNTANGSFNRPAGGHGGAGGYDSSKYGRARNKPS